jgi:hypothetical protein
VVIVTAKHRIEIRCYSRGRPSKAFRVTSAKR